MPLFYVFVISAEARSQELCLEMKLNIKNRHQNKWHAPNGPQIGIPRYQILHFPLNVLPLYYYHQIVNADF